jgi:diguanylate cyclase (GGDEF)-like protein/PAS domain S-box-containing protein
LRSITKLYTGAVAAAAFSLLVVGLLAAPVPNASELLAIAGLIAAVAVSLIRPLKFEYQAQTNLDTAVLMVALLLLEPGYAMLVAAVGGAVANMVRRRTRPEALFNASQLALQIAAGAAVLSALGWDGRAEDFNSPLPIFATLLAGAAMYAVNTLLVAGVISFQDRISVLEVWFDMTLRSNRAELLVYLAQLGIGLLGAIIADAAPWALALLLLPAVAIYLSLEQHVEMRRRAELNLEAAQRLVRLGSWDWDLLNGEQRWSDELFLILGLTPRDTVPSADNYLGAVHPDDRRDVAAALDRATTAGEPYAIDHRIIPGSDRSEQIVHAQGEVILGRNGKPTRFVGTVHDITERKRLEQRLQHLAYHDALTELPNRLFFAQRLDQALRHSGGHTDIAVLFLDLDRFKLINDTFGHDAGDQLLVTVAERLRACVRPGDMVARMGGDEFTILLLNVTNEAGVTRVAERIIALITEPILLPGNREVFVSTSVGIVRPGPEHTSGHDLLRDADNALYRAKERGRNQYVLFDATMGEETKERVALEADLRRAIERDELRVLYQPKIDLATGRAVAVEAFARWLHPTRGWVPPSAFIPIAEETGLIQHIGRWVFQAACREAAGWSSHIPEPPVLSVNLSGRQLHDPELVAELTGLLGESGLPPQRLRLEITESVAMKNADATIQALWRLQRLGVRVVIDDFGTGYSSLSSLQRFPVDTLQLDHSFVANLGRNKEANTIAHAVIGLAHGLGLKVVAEGVERPEQLAHLRDLGCEQAQGNLFSVPLESSELGTYLSRQDIMPPPQPAAKSDNLSA